jgi:hypothetical protein
MRARALRDQWTRAQRGWPPRYPIVQAPNAPLGVALAAWVLARLTGGTVHDVARAAFYAALAAWAWQELTDGTNLLRRAIGAAGLAYVLVRVAQALAA